MFPGGVFSNRDLLSIPPEIMSRIPMSGEIDSKKSFIHRARGSPGNGRRYRWPRPTRSERGVSTSAGGKNAARFDPRRELIRNVVTIAQDCLIPNYYHPVFGPDY